MREVEVNLGLPVAVVGLCFAPLERVEVFSPPGSSGVFLQPLFFRTSGRRHVLISGSRCRPSRANNPARPVITQPRPRVFDGQFAAYRFWNQTCTTLMSRPVSCANCSRTCLAGFGDLLYASFNTSICREVIVVRGLLFPSLPSARGFSFIFSRDSKRKSMDHA